MTDNQQIALILSAWLVISIIIEVLLAFDVPWDERASGDPPPIIGGLVFGALATIAVGILWGIGYGMYWLWTH